MTEIKISLRLNINTVSHTMLETFILPDDAEFKFAFIYILHDILGSNVEIYIRESPIRVIQGYNNNNMTLILGAS